MGTWGRHIRRHGETRGPMGRHGERHIRRHGEDVGRHGEDVGRHEKMWGDMEGHGERHIRRHGETRGRHQSMRNDMSTHFPLRTQKYPPYRR